MIRLVYQRDPKSFLHIPATPVFIKKEEDLFLDKFDNVIIGSILEELDFATCKKFLKHLGNVLTDGATVLASGLDCVEMARLLFNEQLDIKTYNDMIYPSRSAWNLITLDLVMEQINVKANMKKLGGLGNCEFYYSGVKKCS
jgi:hypothetical protein